MLSPVDTLGRIGSGRWGEIVQSVISAEPLSDGKFRVGLACQDCEASGVIIDGHSGMMRCYQPGCPWLRPASMYFAEMIGWTPNELVMHLSKTFSDWFGPNGSVPVAIPAAGQLEPPGTPRFARVENAAPDQLNGTPQAVHPQINVDLTQENERLRVENAQLLEQVRLLQQQVQQLPQVHSGQLKGGKRERRQANSRWAVFEAMKYLRLHHAESGFVGLDENHIWQGPVGSILTTLNYVVPESIRSHDGWPLQPNALSRRLRELKNELEQHGVRINFNPKLPGFRKYKRWIEIHFS